MRSIHRDHGQGRGDVKSVAKSAVAVGGWRAGQCLCRSETESGQDGITLATSLGLSWGDGSECLFTQDQPTTNEINYPTQI